MTNQDMAIEMIRVLVLARLASGNKGDDDKDFSDSPNQDDNRRLMVEFFDICHKIAHGEMRLSD